MPSLLRLWVKRIFIQLRCRSTMSTRRSAAQTRCFKRLTATALSAAGSPSRSPENLHCAAGENRSTRTSRRVEGKIRFRMRILHVVAGLSPDGGGLSELVPRFALEASRLGNEVTIATVAPAAASLSQAANAAESDGVRIARFAPSALRALFFSWDMRRRLPELVHRADVVHVHSQWTFPVWLGCRATLMAGKPLVMSPQGCLDPLRLAHSAWKKRLVGCLDRRFLRHASVIHATSLAERGWIERYVGGSPRVEVIPNGVDVPEARTLAKHAGRTRTVLYLGRLHPLKGLDLLLDAWQIASRSLGSDNTWELVIAGPDEQGTRKKLEQQARQQRLANDRFTGPLYGDDKAQALAEANLFVLPSRTENFGIAIAEALAAGVPVITTKGTPWQAISGTCGWWVDVNVEAVAKALVAAIRLADDERAAMGDRGRTLIESQYQWKRVGREMISLYQDLVS